MHSSVKQLFKHCSEHIISQSITTVLREMASYLEKTSVYFAQKYRYISLYIQIIHLNVNVKIA